MIGSDREQPDHIPTAQVRDAEVLTVELERLLDEALKDTFPASDPLSVVLPRPRSNG